MYMSSIYYHKYLKYKHKYYKLHGGVQLKPHQKAVVKHMKDNYGLILYHSTGSGKTITALASMFQFKDKVIIVGPKSSKKAFSDDILKLKYDVSRMSFYTYAKVKNLLDKNMKLFHNKSVIIDEAHNLRTQTKHNVRIKEALKLSKRVLLLTATPIVNYLNDISALVNIAKRKDVLPTSRNLFNYFYFNEDMLQILDKDILTEKLSRCVSYYDIKKNKDYPTSETIYIKVHMTKEQIKEYKKYLKKIVYGMRERAWADIDIGLTDIEEMENRKKNAFLSATRQLSNTIDGKVDMPKITEIYKKIVSYGYPAVVYSNFLKNGVMPIAKKLNQNNISFKLITGETSLENIKDIVDLYNKGQIQVLLLSSTGSESLDLKNTQQIHVMEPHWNEAKIKQVIGRAIRYKSHSSLKKDKRNVKVFRWVSTFPLQYKHKSADEYLTDVSKKKQEIFDTIKNIIIDESI